MTPGNLASRRRWTRREPEEEFENIIYLGKTNRGICLLQFVAAFDDLDVHEIFIEAFFMQCAMPIFRGPSWPSCRPLSPEET